MELVRGAGVLAGGERQLDLFPDFTGRKIVLKSNLAEWLDQVAQAAETESVVVLASGDPLFFGVGRKLAERLGQDQVEFRPSVTSIQAAFALLKEPWNDVETISLHGREAERLWPALARVGREGGLLALLTDHHNTPDQVAREMIERGQTGWRMAVLENLGQEDQKAGKYSLEEAAGQEFSPLNVVVLKKSDNPPRFHIGMSEWEYRHEAGLITKAEVRSVALGLLELGPGLCLWDLGAGSGSVGLEASLLLPGGRVMAMEQNADRVEMIKANQQRFQVSCLEVFQGWMPDSLSQLPDPDRIFMGGGGQDLEAIVAESAQRLKPGGVMVIALIMLESLEAARRAMHRAGLDSTVTQIQVSRSGPLAQGAILKALNPIWLVKGRKEES